MNNFIQSVLNGEKTEEVNLTLSQYVENQDFDFFDELVKGVLVTDNNETLKRNVENTLEVLVELTPQEQYVNLYYFFNTLFRSRNRDVIVISMETTTWKKWADYLIKKTYTKEINMSELSEKSKQRQKI